jgi:hypothetical protein
MHPRDRRTPRIVLALTLLASVAPADAAPSAAARDSAEKAVIDGKKLRQSDDLEGAEKKFRSAWAYYPSPVTGFYLASTLRARHQLLEARRVALAAVDLKMDEEKPSYPKARADSARLADECFQATPSLQLAITHPPSGLRITVDGVEVARDAWGEPMRLDPGPHVVTATVAGDARSFAVTLAEREQAKPVVIAYDAPKPAEPPQVSPSTAYAPPTPEPPATATRIGSTPPPASDGLRAPIAAGWQRPTGLILGGVGLVATAIGGYAWIHYGSDAVRDPIGNGVCPFGNPCQHAASSQRLGGVVAGLGLAAIVGGVAIYLTAPTRPSGGRAVEAALIASPSGVALVGAF